jgi:hypothetical protein
MGRTLQRLGILVVVLGHLQVGLLLLIAAEALVIVLLLREAVATDRVGKLIAFGNPRETLDREHLRDRVDFPEGVLLHELEIYPLLKLRLEQFEK